jgi:hypothetical protein
VNNVDGEANCSKLCPYLKVTHGEDSPAPRAKDAYGDGDGSDAPSRGCKICWNKIRKGRWLEKLSVKPVASCESSDEIKEEDSEVDSVGYSNSDVSMSAAGSDVDPIAWIGAVFE